MGRSISLKVLHVITGLGVGGAEAMLAAVLTRAGGAIDASVVNLSSGGQVGERLRTAGVSVTDLDMGRAGSKLPGLFRLARIIRQERPDIVQSWMYHADLVSLCALAISGRWRATKLVWGIRCSDMDTRRYRTSLKLIIRLCARLSGLPDAVVINSHAGERVHRALGYHPRQVVIIPNGVDTTRFRPRPDTRAALRKELDIPDGHTVLAHVARVDPMKDHACLLAALERVRDVTALAIGKGTEALPDCPALRRLGPRADVARLLAASDVIVSSSAFGEGFSNAIAEGMAADLPAAATDVGDTRHLVGEAGRIVPPGNPQALADAIQELAELGPEGRAQLGARARVEKEFPLSRMTDAFDALYAQLLENRGAP